MIDGNTSAKTLAGLRFAVLGAGRVGSSLAAWLAAAGAQPVRVASRSDGAAASLASKLDAPWVPAADLASADADLLLIAVPEGILAEVATELAQRPQAPVALHPAGALPASVLTPLGAVGVAIGGFHPLMAFPRPRTDPREAAGIVFGIDGDARATALARRLAAAWQAQVVEVPEESRLLYHYAATLVAGSATTLLALAEEIAHAAGLSPAVAGGYRRLAASALEAASGVAAADAITGPVARGDSALVLAELAALDRAVPEAGVLAAALANETLRQIALRRALLPSQEVLRSQLRTPNRG
jgi:predicted short-subunit dehydrogenase-like oxidoreductase (DUF2520 family)